MLEEKLDLLTKEVVSLRKAVEANTAAGGATSSGKPAAAADEDKPAARGRGRPRKDEPVEPKHDADEVEKAIRQVSRDIGKPIAKKIIASFKCDDLADLLTHPEHFDAAFDKAQAEIDGGGDEPAEDDDI